jgi:hypothetical protein
MQINDTVIGSVLIPLWFSASAVIEIVGGIILWCWLHRRGIELIFMLTGTPGYLELVYLRYCRNQGRSSKRVLRGYISYYSSRASDPSNLYHIVQENGVGSKTIFLNCVLEFYLCRQ